MTRRATLTEVCFDCSEVRPLVAERPYIDSWVSICQECYEDHVSAIRFDDPNRIDNREARR